MPAFFYLRNYWYRIQNYSAIFIVKDFVVSNTSFLSPTSGVSVSGCLFFTILPEQS